LEGHFLAAGEEVRPYRGISHKDCMGWWPLLLSLPIQDNSLGHELALVWFE